MSLIRRILEFLGFRHRAKAQESNSSQRQTLQIIEQNVYTMVNTITFSTDMEKLYLIDNGRAIEFDLGDKGILVGTLNGQISVATAFEFPKSDDGTTGASDGGAEIPERIGAGRSVKLETEKTVWSGAYHKDRRVLSFIGAVEIEIRKPNGGEEYDYKPELHFFELDANTLHIRRKKDNIFVIVLPNELDAGGDHG